MLEGDFALFARRFKEAMLLIKDDGSVIASNPPAQSLFNCNENNLRQEKLSQLLSDSPDKITHYFTLWKSTGNFLPGRFHLKNAATTNIDITIEGCLLKPETGGDSALILLRCVLKTEAVKSFSILNEKILQLTQEIHERSLIEKGLRESEEKVRSLLQSTAEAIYGVNSLGCCTFANNAFLEMMGIASEKEIIGKNLHYLFHHSDMDGNPVPEIQSPVYQAYKGQQEVYVEKAYIYPPRHNPVLVEYWARPISQQDRTLGAVVTIIDITERTYINNALHTLAEGTSSTMGNIFFEACVLDLAEIFDANTAFIGLYDKLDINYISSVVYLCNGEFQPAGRFFLEDSPRKELLKGKPIHIFDQLSKQFPDAFSLIELGMDSYFGAPLISSTGEVMGMVSVMKSTPLSINERTESLLQVFAKRIALELEQRETTKTLKSYQEHLEAQVEQRTNELQQAYRDLESYSYSIAHDLRAPLRSITSFSQILRNDLQDKLEVSEKDYFNRIIRSSKFMAELINDILELSRISRSEFTPTEFSLSKMINEILEDKTCQTPERKFNFDIQQNVMFNGDRQLAFVMMQNLLENAIKFSQKKSETKIEFACNSDKNNHLVCYIRDYGAGFNTEYTDKLFAPFQRLHRREEFEGTGIGLATVKRILERHQGKIWVEAEVEKGACFYFTSPGLSLRNHEQSLVS